jgi:hypothetical protein
LYKVPRSASWVVRSSATVINTLGGTSRLVHFQEGKAGARFGRAMARGLGRGEPLWASAFYDMDVSEGCPAVMELHTTSVVIVIAHSCDHSDEYSLRKMLSLSRLVVVRLRYFQMCPKAGQCTKDRSWRTNRPISGKRTCHRRSALGADSDLIRNPSIFELLVCVGLLVCLAHG